MTNPPITQAQPAKSTITYRVTGMHCPACEAGISSAARRVPGVKHARADAKAGTLTITPSPATPNPDEDALRASIAKAGNYTLGDQLSPPTDPPAYSAVSASNTESTATDAARHANQSTTGHNTADTNATEDNARGYRQLITLGLVILAASVAAQTPSWTAGASTQHFLMGVMTNFMAGFFLAFGFFKLLDLPAFVSGFSRYDLIAGRFRPWAFAYPYIEITLGLLYASRLAPTAVNAVTLVVMLVGGVGVVLTLRKKDRVRCACLGSAIDLPLGPVTLIEDFGMAIMAAAMLVMLHV